jgi:hypothetical protein
MLWGESVKMYLTTFLTVTIAAAILYRAVSIYVTQWWPDAFMLGATIGALATLGAWQHRRTNRWLWNATTGAVRRRRAVRQDLSGRRND